jgi:TonB family protein
VRERSDAEFNYNRIRASVRNRNVCGFRGGSMCQSPAAPPTETDASATLLKVCGPNTPAPCAQVPPRIVKSPAPIYSNEALKAKVQGDVLLLLVIGTDGQPSHIIVQRSLGFGLDEEAIKAVKKWRFQPATMDGMPVAVRINVMTHFDLRQTGNL